VGDVEPGTTMGGTPALELREARGVYLSLPRLPELMRRVKALEKAVGLKDGPSS
jgi:hypothetical protein